MRDGAEVDVFEFAARRHAARESRDGQAALPQRFANDVRRCLAFGRDVGGQDHFAHLAVQRGTAGIASLGLKPAALIPTAAFVLAALFAVLPPSPSFVERWYSTGAYPTIQLGLTTISNLVPWKH